MGAARSVWLWQTVAAGEAGGMVRKQRGKKFWSGRVVNEPMLSMSKGKLSLLLVAPAAVPGGYTLPADMSLCHMDGTESTRQLTALV